MVHLRMFRLRSIPGRRMPSPAERHRKGVEDASQTRHHVRQPVILCERVGKSCPKEVQSVASESGEAFFGAIFLQLASSLFVLKATFARTASGLGRFTRRARCLDATQQPL